MKTLTTIVTMFLLASITSAQQATMTAKPHEVKEGESVSFTVKVEPAPNVRGTVRVIATSATNSSSTIVADGGLGVDATSTDTSGIIPLEGPVGKWTVTDVVFIPYAGPAKKLTATNLPSFEVTPRKVVEPNSAVVEVK